jgi:hypothetical protein
MDWPRESAECAKGIRTVSSRKTNGSLWSGFLFATLALFCGYPALSLLAFRADRFGGQKNRAALTENYFSVPNFSVYHRRDATSGVQRTTTRDSQCRLVTPTARLLQ